jgi:peptidoglycan LD-endopeptidase LytH
VQRETGDSLKSSRVLPSVSDTLTAPDPTAVPLGMGAQPGSSAPVVLPADLDTLRREGLVIPVAGVAAKDLVDSFDDKRGGTRTHNALDIMAARNTPVVSAVSGTILKLHNSTAGGLTIYASDPSSKFVLMYGHLDSYRPGLKEGDRVTRGQIIGFVGSTGNANPLAPHLHFQVTRNDNLKEWWKGTPVNPFLVFRPKG